MWSSNSASHSYLYRLSWTPLNPITVFVLFRYIQGEGDCPGRVGGRDYHIKVTGMLVISLTDVNCRLWSHLECLGWKVTVFAHSGIA